MNTLGPYEIKRTLGRGGMGEVHLARDPRLDREVALKVLPENLADDPDRRMRFLREAKAAASLNHPNITTIFEVGEAGQRDYIAFEYVEGRTLAQRLAEGRLSLEEIIELAVPMAEALRYAHQRGIIHRDLKTANVMVTPQGQPKLLDFGLAKVMRGKTHSGDDQSTTLTISGAIFGTPGAMSPEQALGKPVDVRSDVFSFGSLLHEMCTGLPAFAGNTAMETMDRVIHAQPPSLAGQRRDLPLELVSIVEKALRKDPGERYQHMDDLAADLRHFKRKTDSGLLPPASTRPARSLAGQLVAVTVLLLAAGSVFAWQQGWLGGSPGTVAAPETSPSYAAVMYFDNLADPGDTDRLGAMLARLLTTHLDAGGGIEMLSQQRLYDVARQGGRDDGGIDRSNATEVARDAGIATMIVGEVSDLGGRLLATVEISDAGTGRSLGRAKAQGAGAGDLFAMAEDLGRRVRDVLGAPASEGERQALEQQLTASVDAYRAYVRGIELMGQHQFGDAAEALAQATDLDPSFALAHYWRAIALGWTADEQEQIQSIERATAFRQKLPEDLRVSLDAANIYMRDRFAEALPLLDQVVTDDPNNKHAVYMLGEVYIHSATHNDVAKGAELFDRVLQLDPSLHFIYEHLVSSTWLDGRRDEAWARLARLPELDPETQAIIRSETLIREGRYEEAIAAGPAPAALQPSRMARVLMEDWEALDEEDDANRADALLGGDESDNATRLGKLVSMANRRVYRGDIAAALQILEQVEARDPGSTRDHSTPDGLSTTTRIGHQIHWGRVRALTGEDIGPILEQAAEVQPDAYRWQYLLARHAARRGDAEKATRHLAHLEDLVVRDWSPTAALYRDASAAELDLAQGRPADARDKYARLVASGRLWADYWAYYPYPIATCWREGLAQACAADGDDQAAVDAWRSVVDSGAERYRYPTLWVPALYELGAAELELNHVDEGRRQLQRFLDYWGEADIDLEIVADAREKLAEL